MKVLYVTTISATVNAFLVPHIQTLIQAGYQVDVACNLDSPLDDSLISLGCKVYNIPFQRNPLNTENIQAYKDLDLLIQDQAYDIVHTHTPVASAIVRLVTRKYPQVKVVYTAHGYHFFTGAPLINWVVYFTMEYLLARWTDLTITINSEDYKRAQKYFQSKNHQVVSVNGVGVDTDEFVPVTYEEKLRLRRLLGIEESPFVMTYVGELSFRKNQAFLLQVISELILEEDLLLLLVGDGPEREALESQAEQLGISNFVRFLGRRDDVPKLFAASDLSVSSSRQEGLAVNVMEAMATGLAVVVTDVRGNSDLIEDGENGYIVPEGDIEQFAARIRGLRNDPASLESMGRRSREIVESLNIESINQVILDLHQSLEFNNRNKVVETSDS